ncbi:MAG: hypothetical protein J7496_15665 [Novosphingobium sp.]|nr:hypothetical protein [Novosphingobium sp.]MBO9603939.1 hypothetical protein [Novosphingobium sp.]
MIDTPRAGAYHRWLHCRERDLAGHGITFQSGKLSLAESESQFYSLSILESQELQR